MTISDKHRFSISCVAIILTFALAFAIICLLDKTERYDAEATIVSFDGQTVIAETADGNLWGYNADGAHIGETIILVMDNNGTADFLLDDSIVKIKKN